MQLAADAGLLEINLHVARGGDLLRPCVRIERDADQAIAGQQPGAFRSGTVLDALRDDSFFSVDPLDAVPWRRFVSRRAGGS